MKGGLRKVDFILDRAERGETAEEIAKAEGLPLATIKAVLEVEEEEPEVEEDEEVEE